MSSDSLLSGISLTSLVGKNQTEFLYLLNSLLASKANPPKTSATSNGTSNEDELVEVDDSELSAWNGLTDEDKKKLFSALDTNPDGILSAEELGMCGVDGNSDDLTIKDMSSLFEELGIEIAETDTAETQNPASTNIGSNGRSRASRNNYASTDDDNNVDKQTSTPETVESLEALQTKLEQDKQTELQNMSQISSGSTSELKGLQANIDIAQQAFDKATANESPEVKAWKADLDKANTDLSAENAKLDETNFEITKTNSNIGQTESTLSTLRSSLSNLAQPSGKEGDEDRDAAIIARKKEINDEINAKEAELKALKATLAELNKTKSGIQTNIQGLNSTITGLETQIMTNGNEATQKALTDLNTAKEAFSTAKANALQTSESKLNDITSQINEVTSKINELKNKKVDLHSAEGLYKSMGLDQKGLSLQVFSDALEGYNNLEDKGNGMFAIFDTTQSANKPRYYLFDMNSGKLVAQSTMKTGSGNMGNIKSANRLGSGATLSGFEKIGGEYYSTKMGKRALRIIGLEAGINDNSMDKGTVFHYTQYNHTLGCLGFPPVRNSNGSVNKEATYAKMRQLAPTGTIVYVQPTDPNYKKMSKLYT